MKIIFEEINAEVKSTKQENFQVEFHSPCLESPVLSKQNIQFNSKKEGYCCPKWTAPVLPQLQPIFDDWDYLEDQHLLLAIKTADGMESYGECVISLKSAFATTPQAFQTILTHVGEETGAIRGLMHLKARDNAGTGVSHQKTRKVYDLIYMDTDFLEAVSDNTSNSATAIYGDVTELLPKNAKSTLATNPASSTLAKQNADVKCELRLPAQRPAAVIPQTEARTVDGSRLSAVNDSTTVPAIPPRKRSGVVCTTSTSLTDTLRPSQLDDVKSSPPLPVFHPAAGHGRNSVTGLLINQTYMSSPVSSNHGAALSTTASSNCASAVVLPPVVRNAYRQNPKDDDTAYEDVLRMPASIEEWLTDLGLSQYLDEFMAKGWDQVRFLCDMADDDLIQIGINNIDHRKRILKSIDLLMRDN
jgi:hypothetical protein